MRVRLLAAALACAGCALPIAVGSGTEPGEVRWQAAAKSKIPRTEVGGAAVGDSIYVVGGFREGAARTDEVERYDTRSDSWRTVAPMPVALNHPAVASYGGHLYVTGGYTGLPFSIGTLTGGIADASSDLWRYDPARDTWTRQPGAPTARGAAAAAVVGHELLVAGGAAGGRALTTFEIYDFRTRTWRRGPDLPRATEHVAGVAAGGSFYVLGGRPVYGGGVYSFGFRYRPASGRWERLPDMGRARAGFAAVEACGDVVVMGGEDPGSSVNGTIPAVERFVTRTGRWESLPDMPTPRHGLVGASVGGRAYALEGGPITFIAISDANEVLPLRCPERPQPLRLSARVVERRLTTVRRSRSLRVRVRASAPVRVRADIHTRRGRIGRLVTRKLRDSRTLRIRLSRHGRRVAARHPRLRVTVAVRARDGSGRAIRRVARRTLRR